MAAPFEKVTGMNGERTPETGDGSGYQGGRVTGWKGWKAKMVK